VQLPVRITLQRQLLFCHSKGAHGGQEFLTSNILSAVQCKVHFLLQWVKAKHPL